ncbi:MAG: enoyl-CoA hydratase-related protein [Bacteroidia bacterium]
MEKLIIVKEENVAYITLNRPKVYNSFDREMALALQSALKDCSDDPKIRAAVIRGTGKAFCAGQDLKEAIDPDNGLDLGTIIKEHYNPIVRQIRAMQMPVIAAVNGIAAGAGANLALACDFVIASQNASFLQAFTHIGLIPDTGGTYFLPRLVGLAKATELMMLGEKVPAEEAQRIGMIYKAVPQEEFESAYKALAVRLAKMPTKGLALSKKLLQLSSQNQLPEQLEQELALQIEAGATDDYQEGVNAFLEKRKPIFKGH